MNVYDIVIFDYVFSVLLRVSISVFACVVYILLITNLLDPTLNYHNSDPFYLPTSTR